MHSGTRHKRGSLTLKLGGLLTIMAVILMLTLIAAMVNGAVNVPFANTVKILLKHWGILPEAQIPPGQDPIIFFVRFPRVLTAALVGAALAATGVVMQGMFRNPMADPGILGVSSGAGLGAVTAIALGLSARNIYFLPLFAGLGALLAVITIYLLALRGRRMGALTLILAGMAVSTFIGALTSIVLTHISDYQAKTYIFWSVGGLADRRWEHVHMIALPILVAVFLLTLFSRDLNVLLLGEEEAQAVGLNPSRTRKLLLLLSSITTALAVSVSGSISFVGLIVPHILRMLVGPDHRILLPASIFGGAIFLVLCDLIARSITQTELGVGIITSLVGAPYFLYLLNKARKEGGMF